MMSLVLAFGLGLPVCLCFAQTPEEGQAQSEPLEVEIISMSGQVEIRKEGQEQYATASPGMLLSGGDVIRTAADAYAELGFDDDDDNIVRVEQDTTAVVILKDNEKLQLLRGEVFAAIQHIPPGTAFEIRTPTAVAGARGTEWSTRYEDGETQLEAFKDKPYFQVLDEHGQRKSEIPVAAGYAVAAKQFQSPKFYKPVSKERQQQWQTMRAQIKERAAGARAQRPRPDRQRSNGNRSPSGNTNNSSHARPDGPSKKSQDVSNHPGQGAQGQAGSMKDHTNGPKDQVKGPGTGDPQNSPNVKGKDAANRRMPVGATAAPVRQGQKQNQKKQTTQSSKPNPTAARRTSPVRR